MSSSAATTQESTCATRFCTIRYSAISCACGMPLTLDSIDSSTTGCSVGVNTFGTHPKSFRYSPICLREPRLNGFRCLRMNGDLSPVSCIFAYSSSVRPTLDKLPSFLVLGVTSLTSTHLGLNTCCTSSSRAILRSFNVASNSVAWRMSNSQPLCICCCTMHCT